MSPKRKPAPAAAKPAAAPIGAAVAAPAAAPAQPARRGRKSARHEPAAPVAAAGIAPIANGNDIALVPAAADAAAPVAHAPVAGGAAGEVATVAEWKSLVNYSLRFALTELQLDRKGNKDVLIARLVAANAGRDVFLRVSQMIDPKPRPAPPPPPPAPPAYMPPQLINPVRPANAKPKSKSKPKPKGAAAPAAAATGAAAPAHVDSPPIVQRVPFVPVEDDDDPSAATRMGIQQRDSEIEQLRDRLAALELLKAPILPAPKKSTAAAPPVTTAAHTPAASIGPDTKQAWTAADTDLYNRLPADKQVQVAMMRLTGVNPASGATAAFAAIANPHSFDSYGGGSGNSYDSAYAWLNTEQSLKKFIGVVDAKEVKYAVNGEYTDLSKLLLPTAPSFLALSASELQARVAADVNTSPVHHPSFSQFVLNQTTMATTQTLEYTLQHTSSNGTGTGGTQSIPVRMVNAPKASTRAMSSLDDWREAWFVYVDIVCTRPANERHRAMFWRYQFDIELLANTIGFQRAYEFDCKWRRRQAGFKDLNIEHAATEVQMALTSFMFTRFNGSSTTSAAATPHAPAPARPRANAASGATGTVCRNWNGGRCSGGCGRDHVCSICGQNSHARPLCPTATAAAPAPAAAAAVAASDANVSKPEKQLRVVKASKRK